MNSIVSKHSWPVTTIARSSYLRGRIGWQGLKAAEFLDQGPYLVTGTDFHQGHIEWNKCYHVSEARFAEAGYIRLRNGDLLVTKDGTIGKIAYVEECPEKAVLNSGIFLLRCRDGCYDHRYLFYVLQSDYFRRFLDDNLAGSTIQHLYQYVFERFEFPVPELPEQDKIVEVLSNVDRAIDQTEALIAKQQRIKTGLMQDLLTRGIDEHGNLRSEETHEFKDSPLGRIPVEWEVYKLGHLLIGHQAGIYKKRELYGEGFNIVGVSDLYRHSSISGQVFRRVPLTKSEQKLYTLRAGNLIYGESSLVLAGIAKTLWVTAEGEGTAFAWHTRRLRINKEIVDSQYLYFVLGSSSVRKKIMSVATQTALTGITTTDLFSVPVPIPQEQEQKAAAERLNQIDKAITQEREKHKKLRSLKTALMQDLLTGKVLVTPLFSEPQEAGA